MRFEGVFVFFLEFWRWKAGFWAFEFFLNFWRRGSAADVTT